MDTKLGRYIVNGAHESEKLQDLLDGFIIKFVLCPECDNPETVLVGDLLQEIVYFELYFTHYDAHVARAV